jgi:hypothetical protein
VLGRVYGADLTGAACGNGGEYFYGFVPDPQATLGDTISLPDARALLPIILGHELTHVIQFGRGFTAGKASFSLWELEGQATLTEEVLGHAFLGHAPRNNYGSQVIWNNENQFGPVDWYLNPFWDLLFYFGLAFSGNEVTTVPNAPEQCGWFSQDQSGPCLGRRSIYGVSWSFQRWVSDHFGPGFPGGEQGLHRAMITDSRSGLATISGLTGRPVDELLAQWAAMLYVDDRIQTQDPRLQMLSWNFHGRNPLGFWGNLIQQAQLRPRERGFGQFQDAVTVRAGSTAYFLVGSSGGRQPTAISVAGAEGALPAHMRVWLVRIQ